MTNFEKIATVDNIAWLMDRYCMNEYEHLACENGLGEDRFCPHGDDPTTEQCIECNRRWLMKEADGE